MKKFWRTLGTIALGMILLTGCGDESAGMTLSGQPMDLSEKGMENQGEGYRGQGSK